MAKAKVIPAADPLPRFIIDRDQQARRAGLRLERYVELNKYLDKVISCYHGSPQQIAASGFLWTDDQSSFHWPRGRVPSYARGRTQFGGSCGRVYRNDDGSFLVRVTDRRPVALTRLGPELERYEVLCQSKLVEIVHYGSREALLAAGITMEAAIPKDRASGGMYDENRTWETSVAPNGWWLHVRNLERECALEEKKKSEEESNRATFKDPDKFREFIEDVIVMHSQTTMEILRSYASVETIHGFRYTLGGAQFAELIKSIETASQQIETAAQRIRDVPVKVTKIQSEEAKAAAREIATSASADPRFQRFIQQAIGEQR